MYWYEITLETDADKLDEGILFFNNLDIWSLNIDDPNDMITHQNQVRWDYIDEKLLERDMTKAHVKYYTEDENEALEIRKKAISDGFSCSVDKLKAEDWENGWKKYYKPFKLGEKVVIIPAWEEYDIQNPNIEFPNLIAPDVYFYDRDSVTMGRGNIINTRSAISCDCVFGDFNLSVFDNVFGHDSQIGNFNIFFTGTRISGNVKIGDENIFGASSTVLQNLKIGNGNTLAASSLLVTPIGNDASCIGVPATKFNFKKQ